MTNIEINEYIAEHLFEQTKEWQTFMKENCGEEFGEIPNYIENWHQVVQELRNYKDIYEIRVEFSGGMVEVKLKYHFGIAEAVGNTIGEAVCRATVDYLKRSSYGRERRLGWKTNKRTN